VAARAHTFNLQPSTLLPGAQTLAGYRGAMASGFGWAMAVAGVLALLAALGVPAAQARLSGLRSALLALRSLFRRWRGFGRVLLLLLPCIGVARVPAFAADRRHVLAIAADRLAALASRHACFGRAELMCIAGRVRGASPLCGDCALLVLVHRSEAAVRGAVMLVSHVKAPGAWRGSSSLRVRG